MKKQAAFEAAERLEEDRKKLLRAGVPRRFLDTEISDSTCLAYVKSYPVGEGVGLFIHGKVGTWKSTNASGVARPLALSGRALIMTSALKILRDVKDTFDSRSSAKEELDRYLRCEVLVLDDLGKESASPWSVMTLFEVVNTRLSTVPNSLQRSFWDDSDRNSDHLRGRTEVLPTLQNHKKMKQEPSDDARVLERFTGPTRIVMTGRCHCLTASAMVFADEAASRSKIAATSIALILPGCATCNLFAKFDKQLN